MRREVLNGTLKNQIPWSDTLKNRRQQLLMQAVIVIIKQFLVSSQEDEDSLPIVFHTCPH